MLKIPTRYTGVYVNFMNFRIARSCGATICSRTDEISESHIGEDAGLFEVKKIGEEYFTFITQCKETKGTGSKLLFLY